LTSYQLQDKRNNYTSPSVTEISNGELNFITTYNKNNYLKKHNQQSNWKAQKNLILISDNMTIIQSSTTYQNLSKLCNAPCYL